MISIKRPPRPEWLADPQSRWTLETEAIINWYAAGNKKAFDFDAYSDPRLKTELKKVFIKCAYCESSYGAVYDGDIEHFRPKGRVTEKKPAIPGYYWLANDWDNLLLSCQHCNQSRQHILYNEDKLESYGKRDQFPLTDEQHRTSWEKLQQLPISKEDEACLLLNPCRENPEEHLIYEKEGAVIIGLTEKGKTSIKVYALQRPKLVEARHKVLTFLFEQILRVKEALIALDENETEQLEQKFELEYNRLLKFADSTSDYAGLCRFFIHQFLQENNLGQ
jgi:hypothetical protein